ncbi:MAG TPA: S8 family serine peptidase [Longimicrobium sp.]|jgi:subtilisin family serine protease
MSDDNYLVLRVKGAQRPALESLGTGLEPFRTKAESDAPEGVEFSVDVESLGANDHAELRRDPEAVVVARPMPVALIEPVPLATASAASEPIHGATWGVFATGALQSPYTGDGVTVAVLDTGIDAKHEAFNGIDLVQRDFTSEGNGDTDGHGTHVAGTIFGQTVQGVRYGVAPGVRRALIGKVLGARRTATTVELAGAVQWAADGGASVINMSLGFDFPGMVRELVKQGFPVDLATSRALAQYRDNIRFFDALLQLLRARAAQSAGALLVSAAGNESRRQLRPDYTIDVAPPAAGDGVLAVAALGTAGAPHDNLSVAPFSNVRAAVAAPGAEIYSAKTGGGYTVLSGTSMASPHVAGVAALWAERQLQLNGRVNVLSLDAQLRGNARRLPNASYADVGDGLITAPSD